jgi:hypothetical protein
MGLSMDGYGEGGRDVLEGMILIAGFGSMKERCTEAGERRKDEIQRIGLGKMRKNNMVDRVSICLMNNESLLLNLRFTNKQCLTSPHLYLLYVRSWFETVVQNGRLTRRKSPKRDGFGTPSIKSWHGGGSRSMMGSSKHYAEDRECGSCGWNHARMAR